MMRTSFCETGFVKHASTAAVIALKFAISLLVVISVNEVFETMSGVISGIRHQHDLILAGVLATILVPSAGVVVWGCRAVLMSLADSRRAIHRYSRTIETKDLRREKAQAANGSPHATRRSGGKRYPMNPETPACERACRGGGREAGARRAIPVRGCGWARRFLSPSPWRLSPWRSLAPARAGCRGPCASPDAGRFCSFGRPTRAARWPRCSGRVSASWRGTGGSLASPMRQRSLSTSVSSPAWLRTRTSPFRNR